MQCLVLLSVILWLPTPTTSVNRLGLISHATVAILLCYAAIFSGDPFCPPIEAFLVAVVIVEAVIEQSCNSFDRRCASARVALRLFFGSPCIKVCIFKATAQTGIRHIP